MDILVYDGDVPFLMIECKTWGQEYEREHKKMLRDGGQLFSYYTQDRATKYLCLYTSRLGKTVEYKNSIVVVEDNWRELSGTKEIYEYWNKNFKDNGIFENYSAPYDVKHKALTYGMLRTLKEEDSGKIYNQIMEILRHNAISDKPNAFNKLLNLFVCKIIDENKNADDELEFQWLETDSDESLQMRLNDLYKEGMWRFLEIDVIDHSEDEVSQALEGIDNEAQKQRLKDMFRDARLKKSPNFAFVEVLDNKTFELNAKIVREIVELLQVYKFRYDQKHEFLGNFFELLLNASMKQEAGQFFTPVPITRFIISSLPLKEFVQKRIDNRERDTLPVVMDYACGSGHFLTEYMSQMQDIIDTKINISKALPSVRNYFQSWQGLTKFLWARDSVYGIDLDNRLVKTTKVSAFFNGDGEATIVWANGLGNFEKSDEYRGKLKQISTLDRKNNGQFDILISNPPYSVEAFKSMLKYGSETFELFDHITDNSSEIECLFIERMKQLLKVGGWAGIILPSSILSNGGIHSRAREIIFKYFNVKAIVELGSGTFMKTGTNTVVLFLERRSDNDSIAISRAIDTFFANKKDVTVAGIEYAFSKYVTNVYDDLYFEDYISFLNSNASSRMVKHELFADYAKVFGDDVYAKAFEIEKEKMLYFLLTYSQNIVLVKTGKKQKEKEFLGYEFSERRGHEGMKRLPGGTKLYDESGDLLNPQKANSYIYNAFLGKEVDIDESLSQNVSYGRMSGFIDYGTGKFDRVVNLNKRIKIVSSYPMVKLSEVAEKLFAGGDLPKGRYSLNETPEYKIPIFANSVEKDGLYGYTDIAKVDEECVTISARGTIGFVKARKAPFYPIVRLLVLVPKKDFAISKYLEYIISHMGVNQFGVNIPQLTVPQVSEIKIPIPPLEVQKKIVAEIEAIENEENATKEQIESGKDNINLIIDNCFNSGFAMTKLGSIVQYSEERIDYQKLSAKNYIGVDNLLPNIGGKVDSQYLPTTGSVTAYKQSDILLSNIRPYLKKIWFANNDGGSSNDVLVLTVVSKDIIPKYVYYNLATNDFFDYEMQNIKGVKMPRAKKDTILNYQIPLPLLEKQKEIVSEIEKHEAEIGTLKGRLGELKSIKDGVLKKYL
ncbi:restriction endonuclease subunit S [Pelotomaculum isophthalicicum JI]|uniref:site-specific DNA-methyltransferase (adenine-specific) n=1 Tax=Pelotomaculum isophthalicicum JI TaxID=947010 RepID=A0A9X4H2S1_9FIRM|nr:restriction endonuclease subunit S [Pelotomaculum isophthalicicum]MDF9407503.1 restriction endonuclease subunit S [Pelotomaculum isophthalicicum JI]